MQLSYGKIHSLYRNMMIDDALSPTSLLFLPFDSWIDVQYQIYICRANFNESIRNPFK